MTVQVDRKATQVNGNVVPNERGHIFAHNIVFNGTVVFPVEYVTAYVIIRGEVNHVEAR